MAGSLRYEQIGRIVDITPEAVRKRVARSVEKFRAVYGLGSVCVCGSRWMGQALGSVEPYPSFEEHAHKGKKLVAEGSPALLQDTSPARQIASEETDIIVKRQRRK
jgi:hypothetical protein